MDVKESIENTGIDPNKLWEEIFTTRDTHEIKKKAVNFLTFGLTSWDLGSDMHLFLNYLTGTNYIKFMNCGPIKGTIRKLIRLADPSIQLSNPQPSLNTTGLVLPESDFAYTHHHQHKLNVSNITAVTDPISTKL